MSLKPSHACRVFFAAALVGVLAATPASAAGTEDPPPPKTGTKPTDKKATGTKNDSKPAPTKSDKKSQNEFLDGYRHAYDLIYDKQDYAGGLAALKALGHDDHADVANLIGFSSRKLGRYDDARYWYEKALAADPNHTRTWQYYGMWQLEQGNRLKAEEFLTKIAEICGMDCADYKSLRLALAGNATY